MTAPEPRPRRPWFARSLFIDRCLALAAEAGLALDPEGYDRPGGGWSRAPGWLMVIVQETVANFAGGSLRPRPVLPPPQMALVVEAVRQIGSSPEQVAAFEAVLRLRGTRRLGPLLCAMADPGYLEKERAARTAARMAQRAAHARAKLAEWQAAQARAEQRVTKWARTVAYYAKKGL